MTDKLFCPFDHSELKHVGDAGIVDYDGTWDAQASKFECADGKHVLFVVDPEAVEDVMLPAFEAAETAIVESMRDAVWVKDSGRFYTKLRGYPNNSTVLEEPLRSLEDLRNELAHRAVFAFKAKVEIEGLPMSSTEYGYIHAMEDVDDILEVEEIKKHLKEAGWLSTRPQKI